MQQIVEIHKEKANAGMDKLWNFHQFLLFLKVYVVFNFSG